MIRRIFISVIFFRIPFALPTCAADASCCVCGVIIHSNERSTLKWKRCRCFHPALTSKGVGGDILSGFTHYPHHLILNSVRGQSISRSMTVTRRIRCSSESMARSPATLRQQGQMCMTRDRSLGAPTFGAVANRGEIRWRCFWGACCRRGTSQERAPWAARWPRPARNHAMSACCMSYCS